jgi:hypothetical protein
MSAKYSNNRCYRDNHSSEIPEETSIPKTRPTKKQKLDLFKQFIKKFFNK